MYVVHEHAYDPVLFAFVSSHGNEKLTDTMIYGANAASAKKAMDDYIQNYKNAKVAEQTRSSLLKPLSHQLDMHAHHFDNPQNLATSLNSPNMGRIQINPNQVSKIPEVHGLLGGLLVELGSKINGYEVETQIKFLEKQTVESFFNWALANNFFNGTGKEILNSCFGMDGIRFGHWLGTSNLLSHRVTNLQGGGASKYEHLVDSIYASYPVIAWCLKDRNIHQSDPLKSITQSNYFGSSSVFEEFDYKGVFISSHIQAKILMGEIQWNQQVIDDLIQKFMNLRAKNPDWANALVSGAYNALLRLSCQDRYTWVAQFVEFGGHVFFKTYYKANGSSGTPLKFDGKHQYCIDFLDSSGSVSVNGTPAIFYYDNDHVLNVIVQNTWNFKYYAGFDASPQKNPFTNAPGYNSYYGDYSKSVPVVLYQDRFAFGLDHKGEPYQKGIDLVELAKTPVPGKVNQQIWINAKSRLPSGFKSHVGKNSVYETKGIFGAPVGVSLKETADEAWDLHKIEGLLNRLQDKHIGKYNWTNLVNDFIPVQVLNQIDDIQKKPAGSLNPTEKHILDRVNYLEAQVGNTNKPVQGQGNLDLVNRTHYTHGQATSRLNNTIHTSPDPYHQSEASNSLVKIDNKRNDILNQAAYADNYHGHGVSVPAFEQPISSHTRIAPVPARQKLASIIKVVNRLLQSKLG